MSMKCKSYCSPSIARVALDRDQAILQVCATGGIYFITGAGDNICLTTFDSVDPCLTGVRGQTGTAGGFATNANADAAAS